MKQVNNKMDAQLIKLSLLGTLIASLGACLSFNPETLTIARNESLIVGNTSLASKAPKALKMPTPPKSLELPKACEHKEAVRTAEENTSCNRAIAKVEVKKQDALYTLLDKENKEAAEAAKKLAEEKAKAEKALEVTCEKFDAKITAQAKQEKEEFKLEVKCEECEKAKLKVEIPAETLKTREVAEFAFNNLAKSLCADLADAKDKKKKEEKLEDVNVKLAVSACDELSEDNDNIADIVSCQKDELKDIIEDCKEKEKDQEHIAREEKDSRKDSKDKKAVKVSEKLKVSCTKIVKNYFEKYVKDVMKAGLSAAPDSKTTQHIAGQKALAMMLNGNPIPTRFITGELASEIDALARQADMALVQQKYNVALTKSMNDIQTCTLRNAAFKLPTNTCGTQEEATKFAGIQAANYLMGLQAGGVFGDGTILARAAGNMGIEFMSQYQNQYANPMQQVATLFGSNNPNAANNMLGQYQTSADTNTVVINPNGTVTAQNGNQVAIATGDWRNGRNDLRIAPIQIQGFSQVQLPTQNSALGQQQVVPGQQFPFGNNNFQTVNGTGARTAGIN